MVQRLGDSEKSIADLLRIISNLEKAKKTAETRLNNRLKRPGNENVKDNAQLRYFTLTLKTILTLTYIGLYF